MDERIVIRDDSNMILQPYFAKFLEAFPTAIIDDSVGKSIKQDEHIVYGYFSFEFDTKESTRNDHVTFSITVQFREYHGKFRFSIHKLSANPPFWNNDDAISEQHQNPLMNHVFKNIDDLIKYTKETVECIKQDTKSTNAIYFNNWTVDLTLAKI